MRKLLCIGALLGLAALSYSAPPPTKPTLAFSGGEKAIALAGAYASARVLVEESGRDVSGEVALSLADPKLAVLSKNGTLWPRKDGTTVLTAQYKGQKITIPVTVTGLTGAKPPRFTSDVIPVLTRYGCNQGGCHGATQGKGGFKLSLQGYDPEADYDSITRAAAGRRLSPAQPENSLLLRKPTMRVSHKGGQLFEPGSPPYQLLVDWIAAGMPRPKADEPEVTGLEIVPPTRTLALGQKQRFRVWANFADKARRDVSAEALFSVSDGTVAQVSPEGDAKIVGKGEGAILIRYQDRVATASLLSPFSKPRPAQPQPTNIDRLIENKLAALGLDASPTCSDSDYLRRVSLDLTGLLPTPDTTRAFLADTDPQKRSKLVETLLARPEYVDYWTLKWGDLLRSNRNVLNDKGLIALNRWIRDSVAANKPWNTMARELLLAQGSAYDDGPANYFRAAATPDALTETTSQVFLGVRIQCARCHNHPYEKWKQDQYYQFAAFFSRVKTKNGEAADEKIVYTVSSGESVNPRTGKTMVPTALGGAPVAKEFTGDRRLAFADWLTDTKNPFFAKVVVNRLWKHFLGQGLIEPVDDVRVTNPPTNPVLLDWLAADFVNHGYDLKHTMRTILATRAYQRTAFPTKINVADTRYFSHYFFKRLDAESLLDAVGSATGSPEKFGGYPAGMRAAELPDTTAGSYFLDLFGRPARNIVCQCERQDAPNLGQLLHFMNGKGINEKLSSKTGRIAKLIEAKTPDTKLVEELYLASVSRLPDQGELFDAVVSLREAKDKRQEAEDILWALLNSKEFLFNH
ncbi:DUF1549 and DUF1553 domain-containing protein [Armatimonas rosea]|uniref:Mono/diheme cytochrome c family protein n=1 Tax=Armatimonas rosea TaxID=685828 RepID=A0A7W9W565_ARMRO|nr:DUF1549 and DUF1553 domain-containing protein [Armatimonas rosea]MBB6049248.1 mono/diheme cytochrome c family protein [Armatimonas rosea]